MARWSGKNGSIRVGTYVVGDLQDYTLECKSRLAEVTGIDDFYTQRIGLDQDFRVTAKKFVQLAGGSVNPYLGASTVTRMIGVAADMPSQPYNVELYDSFGVVLFAAPMFIETANYSSPDGAVTEDVTMALAGTPTIIPGV